MILNWKKGKQTWRSENCWNWNQLVLLSREVDSDVLDDYSDWVKCCMVVEVDGTRQRCRPPSRICFLIFGWLAYFFGGFSTSCIFFRRIFSQRFFSANPAEIRRLQQIRLQLLRAIFATKTPCSLVDRIHHTLIPLIYCILPRFYFTLALLPAAGIISYIHTSSTTSCRDAIHPWRFLIPGSCFCFADMVSAVPLSIGRAPGPIQPTPSRHSKSNTLRVTRLEIMKNDNN